MGYIAIAIAVFFLAILLGFSSGCKKNSNREYEKQKMVMSEKAGFIHRSDIHNVLIALSKTEPPKNLRVGAQCYSTEGPSSVVQYVCPKCGEKTLYKLSEVADTLCINSFIERELESCRRIVKAIKNLNIILDESQYCRKCSPNVKSPKLALIVKYSDEEALHRCEEITIDDLRLLNEFLSGEYKHVSDYDAETPLKNHVKRLSELLGVEIELPEKENK